jgi:diguanylate cyclase
MAAMQRSGVDPELQQLRDEVERLRRQVRADQQRIEALEAELGRDPIPVPTPHRADIFDADGLEAAFRVEQSRAKRGRAALSLAFLEIDQRNELVERHGHDVAAQAFAQVAALLQASIRPTDLVARVSAEALVLLLPATALDQALAAAARLQRALSEHPAASEFPLALTFSGGVVQWRHDEALADFLGRAERALAQAKASGLNRTVAG